MARHTIFVLLSLLGILGFAGRVVAQIPDSEKIIVSPDGLRQVEVTTGAALIVSCPDGTCAGGGGAAAQVDLTKVGGTLLSGANVVDVGNTAFRVNCVIGCGASGFTDNSAFTFGTTNINIAGYVFDDVAPNAATENRAAAPRMSGNRVPYSILRDAAGNERGQNITANNNGQVELFTGATAYDARSIRALTATDIVSLAPETTKVIGAVNQGTNPWTVNLITGFALSATQTDRTQKTQITDGTRDGTVKAASTLPLLTDTAFVVTQRDPLPAGTNLLGKVGIDQTTPGTTNRVDIGVFPDNEPFNVAQFGGNAVVTGVGASGVGIPRVTVANDSTIALAAGTVVSTKTALTYNAPTFATVGVASAQALASNGSRKGFVAVNTSNNTISCSVAQTAVLNSGITLWPGGSWNFNEYLLATGAVNCIASAASSNLSIQEMQ